MPKRIAVVSIASLDFFAKYHHATLCIIKYALSLSGFVSLYFLLPTYFSLLTFLRHKPPMVCSRLERLGNAKTGLGEEILGRSFWYKMCFASTHKLTVITPINNHHFPTGPKYAKGFFGAGKFIVCLKKNVGDNNGLTNPVGELCSTDFVNNTP